MRRTPLLYLFPSPTSRSDIRWILDPLRSLRWINKSSKVNKVNLRVSFQLKLLPSRNETPTQDTSSGGVKQLWLLSAPLGIQWPVRHTTHDLLPASLVETGMDSCRSRAVCGGWILFTLARTVIQVFPRMPILDSKGGIAMSNYLGLSVINWK